MSRQIKIKVHMAGVHKAFGDKVVLQGVDLDIHEGESVVIVGGSGTGKSVLIKHMIGLLKPDRGVVEVDGISVPELGYRELTDFRRRFGMAFQEGALFDSMTVAENIAFPLKRRGGYTRAEIEARDRSRPRAVLTATFRQILAISRSRFLRPASFV